MITQGLSYHEITLITKILDEYQVKYHVDAAGGEEAVKLKGGRGDASFYQIEIPSGEFEKLPENMKAKLENYGIYPEMEEPDFSEDYTPKKSTVDPEKIKSSAKMVERIFIVAMITGVLLFIKKVMTEG